MKPTVGGRTSAEFGRGGRGGQVVHGGGGGVRLGLLRVALRPGGAHQARDGHAAARVLVAGVLQRVCDPPQVTPHLIQLLWLPPRQQVDQDNSTSSTMQRKVKDVTQG